MGDWRQPQTMNPESLPIYSLKQEICEAVQRHQLTVICGDTGCGKTTQVPKFLRETGFTKAKSIVVTQPRRISAITVAERVAFELGDGIGGEVGYEVRFQSKRNAQTRILFVTEAILLKEAISDSTLSGYSAVVVDEAHERGIHCDVLLGLLLKLAKRRPDLRIVIMSATLETSKIVNFYTQNSKGLTSKVITVHGRFHPIQIYNLEAPVQDYLAAAVNTVLQIHTSPEKGDIIVFLTGYEEIEEMELELRKRVEEFPEAFRESPLTLIPLFSALSPERQQLAFQKVRTGRKVILSTNIAETAVTIDGIRFVVDTGFAKFKYFDERRGVETLAILPISRSSAVQRSGRAGRVEEGKCYRLFTKETFDQLEAFTEPVG